MESSATPPRILSVATLSHRFCLDTIPVHSGAPLGIEIGLEHLLRAEDLRPQARAYSVQNGGKFNKFQLLLL